MLLNKGESERTFSRKTNHIEGDEHLSTSRTWRMEGRERFTDW